LARDDEKIAARYFREASAYGRGSERIYFKHSENGALVKRGADFGKDCSGLAAWLLDHEQAAKIVIPRNYFLPKAIWPAFDS
jgi:hypothetical protein